MPEQPISGNTAAGRAPGARRTTTNDPEDPMGLIDTAAAGQWMDDDTVAASFRLAAIDIDATLLGADGEISRENLLAISTLRSSGVRVVLASGRSHANMLHFHHTLRLGAGPVISAQGAVVRGALSGAIWYENAGPPAAIEAVTRDGIERGFAVQHYRRDAIYVDARSTWTERDQARNGQPQVVVPLFEAAGWEGVFKVIWLGDPEAVVATAASARARFAGELSVTETDPGYLEFGPLDSSKAVGLAEVAKRLDIKRQDIVAFGDGNNDVPMLRWAGLGVAMPHGSVAASEAADLVAPDGDPESALARGIELALSRGVAGAAPTRKVARQPTSGPWRGSARSWVR
jgi:hypothetical protein